MRHHLTDRKSRPVPRWAGTVALGAAAAITLAACSSGNAAKGTGSNAGSTVKANGPVQVALILKNFTNPYFISMENSAKADAAKLGVKLTVSAGSSDGDTTTQINSIDDAIAAGDSGIIITPNGNAVNPALGQAKAHHLLVIALDTVPTPPSTANLTYATNNFQAGQLIGQYTAKRLNGQAADIAMLDLFNNQVVSVDIQRDHGFLEGLGIDPGSKTQNGQEAKSGNYTGGKGGAYQVVCHQPTQGAIPGGKTAMENCLSANGDVNVVYTINEPAADGALQALKAAGKSNVLVVTIDGSCKYVNGLLKQGTIAADSAQYPGKMASEGVKTIADIAKGGAKPTLPAGKDFIDSGTNLVTANALTGITSQTPDQAAQACWGS